MSLDVHAELEALRRRVGALEEMVFRRHRARKCISNIIERWPGPFTVQQIEQALREFHPDVWQELKPHAVSQAIHKFEKEGAVSRITDGQGSLAALFELTGQIQHGRPGPKFNRRASYESGFRHIVRTALDDLPEDFTLADLRKWIADHMPDAKIPYGSWSSTLYKLTQSEELVCIKGRGTNCSAERKVFRRGPRKVAASGEEVRELERSWSEFRKSMQTAVADQVPYSERGQAT